MTICCASSRSQHWRITRTPTYGLNGSLMLMKSHQLTTIFVWIYNQLVIVSTRSNVISLRAPFKATYLLWMCFVSVHKPTTEVPWSHSPISRPACEQSMRPIKAANSPIVAFEMVNFFLLGNIEDLNLSSTVSNGDSIFFAEGYRANIIAGVTSFVQSRDFRRAARPEIQGSIKSYCNLVFIWPSKQIQVKIILQVRSVKYFVRLFADLSSLFFGNPLLLQSSCKWLCEILRLERSWGFLLKRHDFVVRLCADIIEDTSAEHLLIGWIGCTIGAVVFHLEGTWADFTGNKAVAFGLRLKILFVLEHQITNKLYLAYLWYTLKYNNEIRKRLKIGKY